MQAVIMAGGFGTRLRPLSVNIPKPMVPMMNRPMLYHIIELLKAHNFNEIIMMLYYQPESITKYFGDGSQFGVKIKYLKPESDLGTAGSVRFAQEYIKDKFLVISGDVLTDFNLTDAVKYHEQKNAVATMVLTRVANPLHYGVVITEEDGKIERFLEKPSWGEVFSDTINTGIYVLNPEIFDYIPENKEFDFSKNLYPSLLNEKKSIFGYIAEGYWKDVGNLDEYRIGHYDTLDKKTHLNIDGQAKVINEKDVCIGKNTIVEDDVEFNGHVVIGDNCHIEKGSRIGKSIISSNVRVHAGSQIYGSVIWDRVHIGYDSRLKETVIGSKTHIGDRVVIQVGTVVGDGCKIGADAIIRANIKIWPHKTIQEGSILSTSLVWGEKWNKELFGAYGITGLCNIEITPEFATKVGAAYGAYLGKKAYVLTSRDAHPASRMIKRTMISGLLSAGVKVGDVQTEPIPLVRYAIGKEGEAGGIHVRMSPFDSRVMDIRFFDGNGGDIAIRQEKAIEQLFLKEDFKRAGLKEVGDITVPPRAQEYYKAGYLNNINVETVGSANFKIVFDYAYSSASMFFPSILGELGIEAVALNAYVNPNKVTKTEHEFSHSLEQLSNIVTTLKADIGFLTDTGAEKLFLVDERGKIISDHMALVLIAKLVMKNYKKGIIKVPVHVSSVVEEIAKEFEGIEIKRTAVNARQIMIDAREDNVIFVGDCYGGFIFPEFQPACDAMFAMGKILEMMANEKEHLNKLSKKIPPFGVVHKKIPCPWDKKGQAMRSALKETKGKKSELIDGVKIFFDNSWVLLLPDPDEAYFNVWAEARSEKAAKELLKEYSSKVKEWQE